MDTFIFLLVFISFVGIQPLISSQDGFSTIGSSEENQDSTRVRRQADDFSRIQILMVVDFAVYSWFYKLTNLPDATRQERDKATEQNITRYYAYVFNRTSARYEGIKDSDVKIQLEFGGLIIAKNATAAYWTEGRREDPAEGSLRDMVDASEVLEDFQGWVNDTILPPFDHIVLFTGYNLTYGGTAYYKGLSFPDSICSFSPISVVEDTYDSRTVGFFGREIGRSLGARLDLDGNFCLSTNLNMMTPRFRFPPDERRAKNQHEFSPCSISYFKDFINELETNCLQDSFGNQYPESLEPYLRVLPGDTYGADEQCRLTNGQNSYVCREFIMDYSTICRGMPCFVPETGACADLLPADGTLCGNGSTCSRGVCENNPSAAPAVDNCVFGDQPVLPFGRTCGEIDLEPYTCYEIPLERSCCAKCNSFRTDIADCEFGDRIGTCIQDNCDIDKQTCCALCQTPVEETTTEMYTTTTTEEETTTTTPSTTTTPTTTTVAPPPKCDCETLRKKIDHLEDDVCRLKKQLKRQRAESRLRERHLLNKYREWRRRVRGDLNRKLRMFIESMQHKEKQLESRVRRKEKSMESQYKQREIIMKRQYDRKYKDLDRKYADKIRRLENKFREREEVIVKECQEELDKRSRDIWRMRG